MCESNVHRLYLCLASRGRREPKAHRVPEVHRAQPESQGSRKSRTTSMAHRDYLDPQGTPAARVKLACREPRDTMEKRQETLVLLSLLLIPS
ncbi:hypothetical protein CRUP_015533 [Coryphaenoides rupestris]|nr:hypothetical protein CRUP_015533 [Coryphaenoides rupestris]